MSTVAAGTLQARFAAALLDPAQPGPAGLRCWNGSDPAVRLGVYRNNVIVSLVDALADNFPVVQQLVGTGFFRAMATAFVRFAPPTSPVLAFYGEGFPAFVQGFEPARSLPYLADVATLEWLRQQAMHAADAEPMAVADAAAALADPSTLAGTVLVWHPSAALLCSDHAAVSLWAAHQGADAAAVDAALAAIDDTARAECALVLRPRRDVLVLPLDAAGAAFVETSLNRAQTLGDAAAAAAASPGFDLGRCLVPLLHHGAICAIRPSPSRTPS